MATYTVDVYAIFVNGADPKSNFSRVKQDIYKANHAWEGCIKFLLKGVYFSKGIVNAGTIPADKVFKNSSIHSLIQSARNANEHKIGIYVFYLKGDFLAEGRGKNVIGVSGTEIVNFKSSTQYEFFGQILLTDMAANRNTLAHEFGHILFKRFDKIQNRFINDDPSGPYIYHQMGRIDPAHNNNRKNLMFPISPSVNPMVTLQQCQLAKMSKIVNIRFF
ncbi:hypothetical protein ACIFOT_18555 [Neobacillus sp. NRS-1170]|uniref:hypothetical protein n=1 Tax=Neobacillus sp. NRS-1170 TaxID=3233898 RepID=UPI003D2D77EF